MKSTEKIGAPVAQMVNVRTQEILRAAREAAGHILSEGMSCLLTDGIAVGTKWECMTVRETDWARYSPSYKPCAVWLQSWERDTTVQVGNTMFYHVPYTPEAVSNVLRWALQGEDKNAIYERISAMREEALQHVAV